MRRMATGGFVVFTSCIVVAAIAFLLPGCVGFHYLRFIENDPLNDAVRIVRFENQELELEDGRVVRIDSGEDSSELAEILSESKNRIEVVTASHSDYCKIYAAQRIMICGTGAPLIRIPLIPSDIPRYQRRPATWGTIRNP